MSRTLPYILGIMTAAAIVSFAIFGLPASLGFEPDVPLLPLMLAMNVFAVFFFRRWWALHLGINLEMRSSRYFMGLALGYFLSSPFLLIAFGLTMDASFVSGWSQYHQLSLYICLGIFLILPYMLAEGFVKMLRRFSEKVK